MASFYDTMNYADHKRVEALLKSGGIEYTMRVLGTKNARIKEFIVAEEDMAAAEAILTGDLHPNN